MKTYLNYSGLAVLAHRGGSIESHENTLQSFEYSRSIGCKYVETDVQITSDGVPYIFHDESLKRIVGDNILFSQLTAEEIDKIKLFDTHSIPKLEEALTQFPDLFFQIDVKTDEVAMPALEVITKLNAEERVCIASFNSERLQRIRNIYPNICLSMGPKEVLRLLLASYGLYNKPIQGDCLQIPIYQYGLKLVTKRFVNFVHSRGLKIIVWTINDTVTFKKLIDLKVDGIITDRPKLLTEVLNN
jgi:glycerophosphoryl diester phosphodiesterase|tara:strand:+ start:1670 stop:2401 length:732 start_codon:yes stop_codon:yes gene_type:complete